MRVSKLMDTHFLSVFMFLNRQLGEIHTHTRTHTHTHTHECVCVCVCVCVYRWAPVFHLSMFD